MTKISILELEGIIQEIYYEHYVSVSQWTSWACFKLYLKNDRKTEFLCNKIKKKIILLNKYISSFYS